MKVVCKCEICDRQYDSPKEAQECEGGHTIIKPSMYWLIPFVSMFVGIYHIITKKKAIIIYENNLKWELFRTWTFMSPILIIMAILLLLK